MSYTRKKGEIKRRKRERKKERKRGFFSTIFKPPSTKRKYRFPGGYHHGTSRQHTPALFASGGRPLLGIPRARQCPLAARQRPSSSRPRRPIRHGFSQRHQHAANQVPLWRCRARVGHEAGWVLRGFLHEWRVEQAEGTSTAATATPTTTASSSTPELKHYSQRVEWCRRHHLRSGGPGARTPLPEV